MERNNIIVLSSGTSVETWGSLAEICREYDLVFNTLSRKKYPFEHRGVLFTRTEYRKKSGLIKLKAIK